MTNTEMSAILKAANVSMIEATQLFQVGRATVYRWLNNSEYNPKNAFIYNRACQITQRLQEATINGVLPLPPTTRGKKRITAIRHAVTALARNRDIY